MSGNVAQNTTAILAIQSLASGIIGVIDSDNLGGGGDGSGTHFLADDQSFKTLDLTPYMPKSGGTFTGPVNVSGTNAINGFVANLLAGVIAGSTGVEAAFDGSIGIQFSAARKMAWSANTNAFDTKVLDLHKDSSHNLVIGDGSTGYRGIVAQSLYLGTAVSLFPYSDVFQTSTDAGVTWALARSETANGLAAKLHYYSTELLRVSTTGDMTLAGAGTFGGDILVSRSAASGTVLVTTQNGSSTGKARFAAINDAGNGGYFNAYGTSHPAGAPLAGNAGFGSDTSIVVFSDAAVPSGGTGTIKLSAGGYNNVGITLDSSKNVNVGGAGTFGGVLTVYRPGEQFSSGIRIVNTSSATPGSYDGIDFAHSTGATIAAMRWVLTPSGGGEVHFSNRDDSAGYADYLVITPDHNAAFGYDVSVNGRISSNSTIKPGTLDLSNPGTVPGQLALDGASSQLYRWDGAEWILIG